MGKRLMQNHLYKALENHEHIVKYYQREIAQKEDQRDWRTYEQRVARRMKTAAREIEPVVKEAASMIQVDKNGPGRPEKISVEQKVLILLLKDIFKLSNRKMANLLDMFTIMTGVDISYKTVERCYSDELAQMVIHNMFMILVKRKGIEKADTSGDGTGYSLTVTKHYRNEREKYLKRKNKSNKTMKASSEKKAKDKKRKPFVFAFGLMDLDSRMYIGYGTSLKSEKEAFRKAKTMAQAMGITIKSARLDRYYSGQSITKEFDKETILYLIPKKNALIKGSPEWKRIIKSFVTDPIGHLIEYYQRNNSESGFSEDKKLCGWKVWQKRVERIDTSLLCKGVWHNLMWLC